MSSTTLTSQPHHPHYRSFTLTTILPITTISNTILANSFTSTTTIATLTTTPFHHHHHYYMINHHHHHSQHLHHHRQHKPQHNYFIHPEHYYHYRYNENKESNNSALNICRIRTTMLNIATLRKSSWLPPYPNKFSPDHVIAAFCFRMLGALGMLIGRRARWKTYWRAWRVENSVGVGVLWADIVAHSSKHIHKTCK